MDKHSVCKIKQIVISILALICIIVLSGCNSQIARNRIIRNFEKHQDSFEYIVDYIRDFDLSKYEGDANTDLPLFIDFASSDYEVENYSLMVSAGWMPTVYDKKVEVDEKTSQAVSGIFDLNYAYIGQVATYGKDPLIIYFRIDD